MLGNQCPNLRAESCLDARLEGGRVERRGEDGRESGEGDGRGQGESDGGDARGPDRPPFVGPP